jgi:choline dehydrogenase-like flavoprotein
LGAELSAVEPGGALARFASGSATAFELTTCEFAPRDRYFALAAEVERSETVTVLGGASATEISVGPAGRAVERVTVISGDGRRRFAVAARQFVLAAGGIENARLLLVSRSQHVDGIGNASGHVGRWFQEHIHVDIGHLWPPRRGWTEELRFFRRMAGAGGTGIIGGLRPRDEVQQAEGLLNSEVALVPRAAAFTPVSVRAAAELAWGVRHRSLPLGTPWRLRKVARHPGAVAKAALRRTIPAPGALTAAALVLTTEQAPNPRSRVALSTRRDAYGVPQPKLEWRFTTLDQASLRRTTALVGNTMAEAGLGRVEPLIGERWGFPRLYGCWHHMGTTRMSAHERDGVVDERCRVHGMENLYVAGSSVFPTGGATTVTLSLVALALRLADELQLA